MTISSRKQLGYGSCMAHNMESKVNHDVAADAQKFAALHHSPTILRLVNVWDAVTTRVVSDLPGAEAIATAGHSIAASYGYPDGEHIPLDLTIDALARIAAVTTLPVSADLDGGYGNAGETVRRAIAVGVCGANIEDQLRPLAEATAVMEAAVKAGEAEGVQFVLNARTDAVVKGGDRPREQSLADAIERGRAYLDVGATCIFVPGVLDANDTKTLVEGIGVGKVSVIGLPGALPAAHYEALGVARISYGPTTQNVALTALKRLGESLLADGVVPVDLEQLNSL